MGSLHSNMYNPVTTDSKEETFSAQEVTDEKVIRRVLSLTLTSCSEFIEELQRRTGKRYSLRHTKIWIKVRCRLIASWDWRRPQGFGCSPIKAVRELGSERRETVRSPIYCGRRNLRRLFPSTRGPERINLLCTGCSTRSIAR